MNIEIKETKKNAILSREEIIAELSFNGKTPTRNEIHKEVSKKINAAPELFIIKKILNKFGKQEATVTINKYDSKEQLEKMEEKYLFERYKAKGAKSEPKKEE